MPVNAVFPMASALDGQTDSLALSLSLLTVARSLVLQPANLLHFEIGSCFELLLELKTSCRGFLEVADDWECLAGGAALRTRYVPALGWDPAAAADH